MLGGLAAVRTLEGRRRIGRDEIPGTLVTPAWERSVFVEPDQVERRSFTFCVLEQLRSALRRRDVFVSKSTQWGDPRAQLLGPDSWGKARTSTCRMLGLSSTPEPFLENIGRELDEAYRRTADRWRQNAAVRIEVAGGREELVLTGLDGLEDPPSLEVQEIVTDTAAYSDFIFGLFRLLGFQFSPRLADLGRTRFWRINRRAEYGPLNSLARSRINLKLIRSHGDDILLVAGSLVQGTVRASELIRALQRGGRPSSLARAISEIGRIAKTLHLLAYIDDEAYRRRILQQINRGEGRHSVARAVFFGKRGELRRRYKEGQEDQLGALGLVVNAIVLWNTRYMDAVLSKLQADGDAIADADARRLSPLVHKHLNFLGRYHFSLPGDVRGGELRELRDPNAGLEEEWLLPVGSP